MKSKNINTIQLQHCYLLFLLLVLIHSSSFAQGWEKHYPSESLVTIFPRGNVISTTTDGGALIFTPGFQNPIQQLVKLIKIDQDGVVQYQKYIPDPNNLDPITHWATKTINGGHAIVGSIFDSLFVKKFDQHGQLLWEKSYFYPSFGGLEYNNRIAETLDGGFIVSAPIVDMNNSNHKAYILKVDSVGVFQWDIVLGNMTTLTSPVPIIINSNHTYSLLYLESSTGNTITTLDSLGNLLWTNTIVGPWKLMDATIADDGAMMVGQGDAFPFHTNLIRIDSTGNPVWDVEITSFNGYILAN